MSESPKKRVRAAKDMACAVCNKIVPSVPFYRQATFRCCSRSCTARYAAQLNKRIKHCEVCAAEFTVAGARVATAKYCSNICKGRALKGHGSVRHECAHCHAEFYDSPSKQRKYCSRACINKASRLEWLPSFSAARQNIKRADRLTHCERCGYAAYPEILGVHHKDRNHRNNTPDNLEVLCPNCHSLEHKKHIAHAGHKFKG